MKHSAQLSKVSFTWNAFKILSSLYQVLKLNIKFDLKSFQKNSFVLILSGSYFHIVIFQKIMAEWVAVCETEGAQPVEIETDDDGTMPLSSITAHFPGTTTLKFRAPVRTLAQLSSADDHDPRAAQHIAV